NTHDRQPLANARRGSKRARGRLGEEAPARAPGSASHCPGDRRSVSCRRLSSGTAGPAHGGVLDDFRRDFALTPVVWSIRNSADPRAAALAEGLRRAATAAGQLPFDSLFPRAGELPRLGIL